MKKIFFLILLVLSCTNQNPINTKTHPSPKDIYENKLTRERIKIEKVGLGKDINNHYSEILNEIKKLKIDSEIKLQMMDIPILAGDDTLKNCVAFKSKKITMGREVNIMKIISIESLNDDYVWV